MTIDDYIERRNAVQLRAEALGEETAKRCWVELGTANRHISRVLNEEFRLEQVEGEIERCLRRVKRQLAPVTVVYLNATGTGDTTMRGQSFSGLVESFQGGAVPAWLREYVAENRERIAQALKEEGRFGFTGPDGEWVTVKADGAEKTP